MYVVIAQSPSVDASQVVGPFKSISKAHDASSELTSKGYNTEIVPLVHISDVDNSPAWEYEGHDFAGN